MNRDETTQAQLDRMRSVVGILNSVLAYDREALESRLLILGHRWTRDPSSVVIKIDDLDCFSGKHPGKEVRVVFERRRLARFEEV